MKKVNKKLELKQALAVLAATVTIGTMGGCAKEVKKEEVIEVPSVTAPVDPEPIEEEIVEVDPNAPLFDIQDEEVFNQKVDELFNEVNGLEYNYVKGTWKISITDKEQIKKFIMLLNVENLSDSQLECLSSYDEIDLFNEYIYITYGITEHNITDSNNFISIENYVVSPSNVENIKKVNQVVRDYTLSSKLSDEDKEFINGFVNNYISDIKDETQNSILSLYMHCVLAGIDDNCFANYGKYLGDFDEMFDTISKELPDGIVSLSYEAVDDLKEYGLSKGKSIS